MYIALSFFLFCCLVLAMVLSERDKWVSDIATTVGVMVAVGAACVAYGQLDEAKASAAKSVYKEYLKMSFDNPEFSAASYPPDDPAYYKFKRIGEKLDAGEKNYEQYEFYVAFLLHSAEEIMKLTSLQEQSGWRETLRNQFAHHAIYLSEHDWGCKQYDSDIYDLIEEGVRLYRNKALEKLGADSGYENDVVDYHVPCASGT